MIEVRPLKFRGLFYVYFFAIVQRKYIRKCKSMGNLYCHKSMENKRKENMHGERGLQSRKVMRCIWKMNFNLLPAVVLWGISFLILLVQMFRER